MSTATRTWQEQERLRIEKEKENERKRLEQERERARIEQEREDERKRVENQRAEREKERLASLRAAAAITGTTGKSSTTTTAFSRTSSTISTDPSSFLPTTPGVVACGQSGYFDCAPEHGGGCCPIGFACGNGDLCVSPQLEKNKPPESLPCPGYKGYFACKEDIGGGCCPANYACIKDSRSQCRLSDSNLVFTNVDRLATRIALPTAPPESDNSTPTGDPAPASPSETEQSDVGTPAEAVGIIVGGIMILVIYFLGSYLLFIYRQRRNGFRLHKSFRVLEVKSQWRDARARARNELPSHHGVSELGASTSRPGSPLPPLPPAAPPLTMTVEVTREKQVDLTHPLPPPPPQLRSSLSLTPQTPVTALPVSSPCATLSTLAPTLTSPVATMTITTATKLPPLLPPPNILFPPILTHVKTKNLNKTEKREMLQEQGTLNAEQKPEREAHLEAVADEQDERQVGGPSSNEGEAGMTDWI